VLRNQEATASETQMQKPLAKQMRGTFMIFGATGDLTGRYLMPAIAKLVECDGFPLVGPILGVGQHDWTTPQFQRHIAERLPVFHP